MDCSVIIGIPQPRREVLTASEHVLTVGRKGHPNHPCGVANEATQLDTSLHIPQPCRFIFAASEHVLAIGREHSAPPKRLGVANEAAHLLAAMHIPEPRCLILAAGEHVFAIRRKGYTVNVI